MTNYLLAEVEVLKQIKEKYEKALEVYKELFPITLIEIQEQKYISIPADDIRRGDILFRISDEKYNILKEVLK